MSTTTTPTASERFACPCRPRKPSRRGLATLALAAATAGGVVALAAFTTWWVLLALIPLALILGCAARRR